MKTHPLLILAGVTTLVLPFSAPAQEAKKYQLKLDRPDKAGDKSHEEINATLEKSQRLTRGDKVLKEEASDTKVTLSGTLEVLESSDKGKIKKLKFTVEKFTRKEENKDEEHPLKAGTVLTGTAVEGKRKNKFDIEGEAVEEETAEMLRELLPMSGADKKQVGDDVIFGSKEPKAAGSEWKVDPKVLVESLPDDMPFKLKEEGVSGKVKFPSVKTVDGVESCQIQVSVKMKPDSLEGLPPNFKADKMSFKITGEKLAPVDNSLIIPYEKVDHQTDVSGSFNSPGGAIKLEMFQRTVRERTSKVVK